jgi:transposase-like protein
LVFLGVLLYGAGLSHEKASGFLTGMVGRNLESFVTIWRDVQAIGEKLRRKSTTVSKVCKDARITVGMDGTYVRVNGKEQPVLVGVNTTDGTTITMSLVNEWKEKQLRIFLQEVAKQIGLKNIKGLVTDDLDSYKLLSGKQKILHQVCVAHVRKNLKQRLKKLEKKIPRVYIQNVKETIETWDGQLLEELKTDPILWNHPKRMCKSWIVFRRIIGDLFRNWKNYTAYLTDPTIPSTNNVTERAIGRSKNDTPYAKAYGFFSYTSSA